MDATGNVYVSTNLTIVKVTPAGDLTTLAGSPGQRGSADGTGSAARFSYTVAMAVDGAGTVYVADDGNNTVRKVSPAGVVTRIAGVPDFAGSSDGIGLSMRFKSPCDIALGGDGTLYVADCGNDTIRKILPDGRGSTFVGRAAKSGIDDGAGSGARFSAISGMTLDRGGNLYVVESSKFDGASIRRVTPGGVLTTISRARGLEGAGVVPAGLAVDLNGPSGIAVDAGGNLYISDYSNVIWKVTPAGQAIELAGARMQSGYVDGKGSAARFDHPRGIAVDSAGKVYVADSGNNRVRVVSPEGVVTTLAVKPASP